MFKVALKVHKVSLRIKENVQLALSIRRGEEYINSQEKAILNKCQAQFSKTMEFLVPQNNPSFEIVIVLLVGENKKLGGSLPIKLNQHKESESAVINEKFASSPDSEGNIQLQFVYALDTAESHMKSQTVSKMQQERNGDQIEIQNRYNELINQKEKLNQALHRLQMDNASLSINRGDMNDFYHKSVAQDNHSTGTEAYNSEDNMNIMKEKMNRLRELVDEMGNKEMKEEMNDFFTQQKQQADQL